MKTWPIEAALQAALLAFLGSTTICTAEQKISNGALVVILGGDHLSQKEAAARRINMFVAEQLEETPIISTPEMIDEARAIAAKINQGLKENRMVTVSLINGTECYPWKEAIVEGYWITLHCHPSAQYSGPLSKLRPEQAFELKVRASAVLVVNVGSER